MSKIRVKQIEQSVEDHLNQPHAPANAERNVIVGVQANGVDLTPDANRKVNVIIPTTLPANGGNSDTVDGKHASDFISTTEKGSANGVATLVAGKIPSEQLPSYVDDVIEGANLAALNALPAAEKMQGKIYVALDTNITYRWSGSAFVEISSSPDIATQAEAETGAENTKMMTALRVKQAQDKYHSDAIDTTDDAALTVTPGTAFVIPIVEASTTKKGHVTKVKPKSITIPKYNVLKTNISVTGTQDGVNKIFTIAGTDSIIAGSLTLYINGVAQVETADYALSGTGNRTITLTASAYIPQTGDDIKVSYMA